MSSSNLISDADAERAITLLRAAKAFLQKQKALGYFLDHPITVFYDEADCDGYCLLDDITACLEDIEG